MTISVSHCVCRPCDLITTKGFTQEHIRSKSIKWIPFNTFEQYFQAVQICSDVLKCSKTGIEKGVNLTPVLECIKQYLCIRPSKQFHTCDTFICYIHLITAHVLLFGRTLNYAHINFHSNPKAISCRAGNIRLVEENDLIWVGVGECT